MMPQQAAAYPVELPPQAQAPQVLPAKKSKKARTFPEKLMDTMLTHGREDVVAWLPDGKSFVVVDPDAFVDQVLNPVFKQAKYSSFVRKLHRWGFVRLTSGTGTDCFHHPFFNRNRRDWASKIVVAAAPAALPPGKAAAARAAATPKASPPIHTKNIPSLAGMERFIPRGRATKADASKAKGLSSNGGGEEEDVKKPAASEEHPYQASFSSDPVKVKVVDDPPSSRTKQVSGGGVMGGEEEEDSSLTKKEGDQGSASKEVAGAEKHPEDDPLGGRRAEI